MIEQQTEKTSTVEILLCVIIFENLTKLVKKELQGISSESIRGRLKKVEIEESYSELVGESLATTVFGQEDACMAVASIVTRFEAGLINPNRPAGIVFFLGPTGTGKTEMGKAVALHLFGQDWKKHFKKIDCEEYSEPHTISRFLGAPPSYVGYGDETVFDNDFLDEPNVIIFDEIEKADPALWKLLLGVFNDGIMTARTSIGDNDTMEDELNFSKSLIILTSNVGAQEMQESLRGRLGFLAKPQAVDIERAAKEGLKRQFASIPEFLGRIDEFVVFKPLEMDTYRKIYWKFIDEINGLLENNGVILTTTNELTEYLINLAVGGGQYGARDIQHVVDKQLVKPLADMLNSNSYSEGLVADLEDGKIVFYDLTPELSQESRAKTKKEPKKDLALVPEVDLEEMKWYKSFQAQEDGYEWILKDKEVGDVMARLLYVADYERWKWQADQIEILGDEEKMRTKRVLSDAFRMMEDGNLRKKHWEDWKVFRSVLEGFGVEVS